MSEKCMLYDEVNVVYKASHNCPMGNLTADCFNVSDVKLDLAPLPPQIDSLCIVARRGLVLPPKAFVQFSSLERLYIEKCLAVIHPGAFAGLSNLRILSFQEDMFVHPVQKCCSASVRPNAFGQLPSLVNLTFYNYNMSTMSAGVFSGLKDLKDLSFHSCGTELMDIACRIADLSQSLTSLYFGTNNAVTLRRQSCPCLDNALMSEHFKALKSIRFFFPNLQFLGESVFMYFRNISYLYMPVNAVLKRQLSQSGVRKIADFKANLQQGGFRAVCEITFIFSVENLQLELENNFALEDDVDLEGCIGLRQLTMESFNFLQGQMRFLPFLKNLQVLNLQGSFLQQSLDHLCEQSGSSTLLHMLFIYSGLKKLTSRQFSCLSNLRTLDLSENKISIIEDFVFEGLDKLQVLHPWEDNLFLNDNKTLNGLYNLEYLDLSGNDITSINFTAFEGLKNLKVLKLRGNMIAQITVNHLNAGRGLANLKLLDLNSNCIAYIDDFAFKQMTSLKTLILDKNKISEISNLTFFGLNRLETLMIEYNALNYLAPSSLSNLTSLSKFSVGCLKHPSSPTAEAEINLGLLFGRFPVNLTELFISSCSRPMRIVIGSKSSPKPGLSLYIYGQNVQFVDCEKPFFQSVVSLVAIVRQLLCGSDFAGKYFKSLENFSLNSQVMTSFVDLVGLNTLVHLQKLKFTNIDLSDQPNLGIMLRNLTTLKLLDLEKCRVPSLMEDLTKDLRSLKYLSIYLNNDLNVIENFARPLVNLRYVYLYNMVLRCSCDNAWFDDWVKYQRQVFIVTRPYGKDIAIACRSVGGIQNFAKYTESSCSTNIEFLLFFSTSLWILFFMFVVLVHNLAGEYLLSFIYIARGWMEESLRGSASRRYQYDVFVSYSGMDERWVTDELLPNLERRGPPFLRVCLHSRDFSLGVDIVENITESLYKSRHTLCLLSRHYLRSKWCSLEMKLATHRLLVEQRDVLIVVFLEKISPKQISAHHRLARIVKWKTYIDWPEEPQQQMVFWDRLWAKLAPKPVQNN
ncbi:toll-like receptor 13 isoform X1 [Silurus asotus]|uniref:Toll-like receptor 13 isoform X1 n=1 Tax=Silurus asotus TaxID=30991 RepID=A0AAD5FCG6_SILAS|nr:toll-like receptor 13 isoform X1 [Silurus asotus]